MAEANTSSTQQSFDAQQMDNQAMEQAPDGGASGGAGEARADAPVSTQGTGQPDGPSLLNNTANPNNNNAEQRARGADSALGTSETASTPRDGGGNANNNLGGPEGQNAGLNPVNSTATAEAAAAPPQQDGGGQNNGGQNGVTASAGNAPSGRPNGASGAAGNVNAGNGANGEPAGNSGAEGSQTGPANPSPPPTPPTNPTTTPIEAEAATPTAGILGGGGGTPNDPTANPDNSNSKPSAIPTTVSFNPNSQTISANTSANGNVLTNDSSNGVVLAVTSFTVNGQTYQAGETATLDGVGTLNINANGSYNFSPNNGFNGNAPSVFYATNFGPNVGSTLDIIVTPAGVNDTASVTVANDVVANAPDSTVYEAGLPAGSSAAGNTETDTGSFTVSASDGIKEIVVGGTTLSLADLKTLSALSPSSSINTGEGTLQITSYSSADSDKSATVGYTYTLNAAQTHDPLTANINLNDGVSITVNGIGGSTDSDTLNIRIVDDVPTATNDGTQALTEDGTLTVSGNALTNDSYGADGVNATTTAAFSWNANTAAQAELAKYGTLTLDTNGDYKFELNNTSTAVQSLKSTDVKTQELSYTITDADGDTSTQHVTITITGTNDAPVISAEIDQDFGSVQEDSPIDGLYTASGQFSSDDVDLLEGATWSIDGPSSEYGSMSIDQTGKWTYTLNNDSAIVQALAADQSFDEIYTITVTDESGAFDTKEVTIIISGTNDAPVISAEFGQDAGSIQEDVPIDGLYTATGQFTSSDIDILFTTAEWDIVSSGIDNCECVDDIVSISSDYGSMAVDTATGKWTFTLDNTSSKVQALAADESFEDIFTITVTDDKGAFATKQITVTIMGTNDAPVISAEIDQDFGSVQEDNSINGLYTASGQFTSDDIDLREGATWSFEGPISEYGSMSVDQTGTWTYTLNNDSAKVKALAKDESFDEIYTIKVTDESGAFDTKEVTIIISGDNDAPVISADSFIPVILADNIPEEGAPTASGEFISSDIDNFATAEWNIIGSDHCDCEHIDDIVSVSSIYGSMSIERATGQWTYTLDNLSDEIQALAVGESINDIFTITVTDEKGAVDSKEFTITIQGTSDVPVISAAEAPGNVQEDVKLTSVGQFISSVDDSVLVDWSVEGPISEYGSMIVDQTGKWTYTLNNDSDKVRALAADESFKEIYTIKVTDKVKDPVTGETVLLDFQDVTVTIAGNNDRPVISAATVGQDVGRVQEDKPVAELYTATGQFTSSDVDFLFKTATWSIVGSASSDYGSIVVDQTGKWTYTLNNDSSEVQALLAGESIKDVFTIAVTDDKDAVGTKDVTITIFGTNDMVTGGASIDVIYAGVGEETIIGRGDADILTGGTGADIFQYTSLTDLTTTPESIEKITDFSSADGDKIDFTSLLSSASNLTNTIKIDSTNGDSSNNLVSFSIGGSSYLMDVNNANPGAGSPGSFYAEIDSQALLGNPALGTQASWTDVVDLTSTTGFLGDTGVDSITGDGWTLKVLDAGVTYQATDVGGTSTMEFFRGADKATDVNVQITTSDGIVHDVNNADKITWHG